MKERDVIAIASDGTTLKFDSTRDAARAMNIYPSNIVTCVKGRTKTAGGYRWEYAEDYYDDYAPKNTQMVSKQALLAKRTVMWGGDEIGFKECVLLDDILALPETELIRCAECKHWADGADGCTDHVKCCKIGYYMVGENGYCVYAERKTDESDSI